MLNPVPDVSDASLEALPAPADAPALPRMTRGRAIAEVVLCSSYPTQVAAAAALAAAGIPSQNADGGLNVTFVFALSTVDALLVVGLIVYLLRRQGESLAEVFLGRRPVWREALLGVMLVPLVTLGVAVAVLVTRALFPSLHNVAVNPMSAFMSDPAMAVAFGVVVVVAGGLREEMQRAFQLHRLTGYVCGPLAALAITSVAFGLGHTVQGRDVALATFLLGAFWGALYLRRRSLVAASMSHGLFNLGQVVIGLAASRAVVP